MCTGDVFTDAFQAWFERRIAPGDEDGDGYVEVAEEPAAQEPEPEKVREVRCYGTRRGPMPPIEELRRECGAGLGGELGEWTVKTDKVATRVENVAVRAGDAIDFVVDCRAKPTADAFSWAPIVRQTQPSATDKPGVWSANTDFAAPPPPLLSAWEQCAQALLLTNEFWFVD